MITNKFFSFLIILLLAALIASPSYCQDDDTTKNVLKQGLLGAGTGAIAAGASGGKAGQGALIGAGTGIIGSMLLDAITTPSSSNKRSARASSDEYYDDQQGEYYEEEVPQESSSQKVLKQGLVGAGTGAIAAGASGGNAGTGALIGAGTGVIGGALLDSLSQPSTKKVYRKPAPRPQQQVVTPSQNLQVQEETVGAEGSRKKIVKKYDASGKLVSEEEIYY